MRVSKWGNSLAIRIPKDVVETLVLKEGDEVDLHPAGPGRVELVRLADRTARIERLREILKGTMPAGHKFDRDEANER